MNDRKERLTYLVTESVRILQEQQGMQPTVPPVSAVPASPTPPAPETNPTPQPETPQPPAAPQGEKPFDVDSMIDRLNTIRGGKSFADPEIYGQLSSYFNGLNEQDKGVINNFLESVNRIVVQVDPSQQPAGGGTQPAMNQQPTTTNAASGGPGGAGVGISPTTTMAESYLQESLKKNIKFNLNGKEFDFGSQEHLRVLKMVLMGLQGLRDCYNLGSANRHVYSAASSKLKKHLESLMNKK